MAEEGAKAHPQHDDLFVPVPGLTAAGQTLIVVGSRTLWDPGVVLAGAAGMTLAESTAYLAGTVARGVSEERQMPLRGRLGEGLRRAAGWGGWGVGPPAL